MLAVLIAAAAALPPAPREALLDDAPAQVTVARAQPRGEPLRGVALNVDRRAAVPAKTALYPAAALGTVLVKNPTKSPRPRFNRMRRRQRRARRWRPSRWPAARRRTKARSVPSRRCRTC